MIDATKFQELKDKLIATETKIFNKFGIGGAIKCSKCGQNISHFDRFNYFSEEYFDEDATDIKFICPICQSAFKQSGSSISWSVDIGDEDEILDHYLRIIHNRVYELYSGKISCGINPYINDFTYSELIVDLFIILEVFMAREVSKILEDEVLNNLIVKYIIEKKQPGLGDYIALLEICELDVINKSIKKVRDIQYIRNDIVHRGYKANFEDFASAFIAVGDLLAELKNENWWKV